MRLNFPATGRNRDVIARHLVPTLLAHSASGLLVEIASGSGEHTAHFAPLLSGWELQPTDLEPEHVVSCDAWAEELGLSNVRKARSLDVTAPWPVDTADAVFCANMIHIAPWECTPALFAGAAKLLSAGDPLVLYGPFKLDGKHTAPSNEAFDVSLKSRNPTWGVRDLADVEAAAPGFKRERRVEMPANNQLVVFRRS